MAEKRRSRSTEAFYGRRAGKSLRPRQAEAIGKRLPELQVVLETPPPTDAKHLFAANPEAVTLEIGFGGGEHLLHRLNESPSRGFIGAEPFINGMAKFVSALPEEAGNIRLYNDDATRLLDWLPEKSIDEIYLLYPDPWPKKRHWKRRFVSKVNLDRLARVLKPCGTFRFASDIAHYVNWTLIHCRNHPSFEWNAVMADDWRKPFPGWPGTRYEAKAIREGRTPAYLEFRRT